MIVSMKYLAVAILFDDFSLTIALLCWSFSIFQFHLTFWLNNLNSFWDLFVQSYRKLAFIRKLILIDIEKSELILKFKRVYIKQWIIKKQFNSKNYRMVGASIRQLLFIIFFARVVAFSSEKVLKFRNIQSNMEEIWYWNPKLFLLILFLYLIY